MWANYFECSSSSLYLLSDVSTTKPLSGHQTVFPLEAQRSDSSQNVTVATSTRTSDEKHRSALLSSLKSESSNCSTKFIMRNFSVFFA